MKKEYIQPLIEAYDTDSNTFLAGSLQVKKGNTGEQCAKSSNIDFEFDEDDEDDFINISSNNSK